jgi:hypothetical protein
MARVESMPAGVVSQTVLRLLAAEVGPESEGSAVRGVPGAS